VSANARKQKNKMLRVVHVLSMALAMLIAVGAIQISAAAQTPPPQTTPPSATAKPPAAATAPENAAQLVSQMPGAEPSKPYHFPPVATKTLANGLRVFVVTSSSEPAIGIQLLLTSAGSVNDPQGKPGVAVKKDFDLAMDLLSDVTLRAKFADEEIARQKQQLLSTLRVNYDDADYLASAVFERAVYGLHPYGLPTEGTPISIQAMSRISAHGPPSKLRRKRTPLREFRRGCTLLL
jgi:hypothetical protein